MSESSLSPSSWIVRSRYLLVAAGVAAYAAVVLAVGVPCFFNELTGLYCCGCGGTRAALALLQGDFGLAARQNPWLVFVVLPWLVGLCAALAIPSSGRLLRAVKLGTRVTAFSAIAFIVVRNVPLPALEVMRPLPARNSRQVNVMETATTVALRPTSILPVGLERIQAG